MPSTYAFGSMGTPNTPQPSSFGPIPRGHADLNDCYSDHCEQPPHVGLRRSRSFGDLGPPTSSNTPRYRELRFTVPRIEQGARSAAAPGPSILKTKRADVGFAPLYPGDYEELCTRRDTNAVGPRKPRFAVHNPAHQPSDSQSEGNGFTVMQNIHQRAPRTASMSNHVAEDWQMQLKLHDQREKKCKMTEQHITNTQYSEQFPKGISNNGFHTPNTDVAYRTEIELLWVQIDQLNQRHKTMSNKVDALAREINGLRLMIDNQKEFLDPVWKLLKTHEEAMTGLRLNAAMGPVPVSAFRHGRFVSGTGRDTGFEAFYNTPSRQHSETGFRATRTSAPIIRPQTYRQPEVTEVEDEDDIFDDANEYVTESSDQPTIRGPTYYVDQGKGKVESL